MFEISKIAYDLYVQDWIDKHTTPDLRLQNIREYYSYVGECLAVESEPYIYKEWLSEFGFNGSFCVCYEEFCDMEYHDKDYIRSLLGKDDTLIEMYYQDIEDYLEKEALSCDDKLISAATNEAKNKTSNHISFIDDLMDGKAAFSDIDKYVEYWHTHETGKTLQNFLGLTDEEMEEWGKSSVANLEKTINKASHICKGKNKNNGEKNEVGLEI